MRPERFFLNGNKGTETPVNLCFFDTESLEPIPLGEHAGVKLSLRLWVAVYVRWEAGKLTRRQVVRGHTPTEFWEHHERRQRKREPLWAFAHNLGHDLTQLHFWRELEGRRFTLGPVPRGINPRTKKERPPWKGGMCLEGRPSWLIVRGKFGTCRFVDTGNYWPSKLAAIGEAFGLDKLKMPAWAAPESEWFDYCQRDAEVCEVAVLDLMKRWRDEDCGVFKMTAPSLALAHFQHTARCRVKGTDKLNIVLEPNHPAGKYEREAYYGGRVEPFYLGELPAQVHHLDCNSLYLSVMSGGLFPRKRAGFLSEPTPAALRRAMSCYGAVAHVLIRSDSDTYPLRLNDVQCHCRGTFWTWLLGPELQRALNRGHVAQVRENVLYSLQALFTGWADYWFDRKQKAAALGTLGAGEYEFAKLVGNSLSGKWGQRGEFWKDRPGMVAQVPWGQWLAVSKRGRVVRRFRGVAGFAQERVKGAEPGHSFPAISAYITSYAREYMRSVFQRLPAGSLLYTATDSLIVTDAGLEALEAHELVDPTAFGKFKLLGTYPSVTVSGPNWYSLGDKQVRAGLHGRPRPFERHPERIEMWQQLPSVIGSRPTGDVLVAHVDLKAAHATLKGTAGKDGWVEPFALAAGEPITGPVPRLRRLR